MARAFPGSPPSLFDEAVALVIRARRRLRERRYRLSVRPRMLDDHRAEVTILGASRLLIDRNDHGLSQSLMDDGYWEMWLTEALAAVVKPGMTVIDIGANVGYFTIHMAQSVGPTGRVHSFEPNPAIAALLRDSAVRAHFDDRILFYAEPLWDADGAQSLLKIPKNEPKNAHLVMGEHASGGGISLITRRLDSFPELLNADVIKIDVEGAEEHIWRGMSGLFACGRPLVVFLEYSPIRYADPMEFLNEIMYQGFDIRELSISYGIRPVTPDQVLSGNDCEDRMLVLVRGRQL